MRVRLSRLLLLVLILTLLCFAWLFGILHRPGKTEAGLDSAMARAVAKIVLRTFDSPSAVEVTTAAPSRIRVVSDLTKSDSSKMILSPVPTRSARVLPEPGSKSDTARISHILHQTWINDMIPSTYVPFVKSWIGHSPPLSYYYWTDAKSVEFVAKHYPHLLAMFKGYKVHLNRADAIRYMLLHHYGGVYADMDMLRLKDLTPLLNNTAELCYLSQERYEITRLYWGIDSSVMNAIMLSSPGHRFMEFVVNALPRYAHHSPNVMESTGPFFLQNVYNEFMKSPPCSLSEASCRCSVADPYMFMPQIDPIRIPNFRGKCSQPAGLAKNAREACAMLDKINWQNEVSVIGRNSYTHHGFLHYGFENQRLHFDSQADISSIRKDKMVFGIDFT